jgi:hypothetical protein
MYAGRVAVEDRNVRMSVRAVVKGEATPIWGPLKIAYMWTVEVRNPHLTGAIISCYLDSSTARPIADKGNPPIGRVGRALVAQSGRN